MHYIFLPEQIIFEKNKTEKDLSFFVQPDCDNVV